MTINATNMDKADVIRVAAYCRVSTDELLQAKEVYVSTAACYEEDDFLARTGKRIDGEWNDDRLIRILEKVVVGEKTVFRGGMEISKAI